MATQQTKESYLSAGEESLSTVAGRWRGSAPKIMVVEDEFLFALAIKQTLIKSGFEVLALVGNGEEAICRVSEVQPDLILMDIALNGQMSGIEAAAAIRKDHAVPILYLTAHADADLIESAKTTEPFGFLSKPCNMVSMVSTIKMALHKNTRDSERRRLERRRFDKALSIKTAELEATNTALTVFLERRERERRELELSIKNNISKIILPSLLALENSKLTEKQKILTESIKLNLQLVANATGSQFHGSVQQLSSTEMQVANFVKAGKSTKEIAQFLEIAVSTVNTHRDSIRKKLGIKNTKTNLKKVLQKML